MDDGFSLLAVVQSLSSVTMTLQCSNMNTSDITVEQSIFGTLDVTSMPSHGAKVIHTMCLEAGIMYEARLTFLNFGFSTTPTRLLFDSVSFLFSLVI